MVRDAYQVWEYPTQGEDVFDVRRANHTRCQEPETVNTSICLIMRQLKGENHALKENLTKRGTLRCAFGGNLSPGTTSAKHTDAFTFDLRCYHIRGFTWATMWQQVLPGEQYTGRFQTLDRRSVPHGVSKVCTLGVTTPKHTSPSQRSYLSKYER